MLKLDEVGDKKSAVYVDPDEISMVRGGQPLKRTPDGAEEPTSIVYLKHGLGSVRIFGDTEAVVASINGEPTKKGKKAD